MLSTKVGKEAYVEPVIEDGGYRFTVKVGKPKDAEAAKDGTKLSQGELSLLDVKHALSLRVHCNEANAGRMGERLMAIVAEGDRGRVYLAPTPEMEAVSLTAQPTWKPDAPSPGRGRQCSGSPVGLSDVRRLLHPPPARGADDLLRPGAGSARAGAA